MSESARFGKTNSLSEQYFHRRGAELTQRNAEKAPRNSVFLCASAVIYFGIVFSSLQSILTADSSFFGGSSPLYKIFSRKSPEGGAVNFEAAFD